MEFFNQKVRIKNIVGFMVMLVLLIICIIHFNSINTAIISFVGSFSDLAKSGLITVIAYTIIHIVKSVLEFIYTKFKQTIQFYKYKKNLIEYLGTVILLNDGGAIRIPYLNRDAYLDNFTLLCCTDKEDEPILLSDSTVSLVLYYLNMKYHLSLGEKEKLYSFLRNMYPKLFIEQSVLRENPTLSIKNVSLQLKMTGNDLVLNEWSGGIHLRSSSDFLLKDILREVDNYHYDNYIKNFVEENYK